MSQMVSLLFWGALKAVLFILGVLYVGLVLMSFRTEGPRYRFRMDLHTPGRSAKRFLVWLGVRALAGILRAARSLLGVLSEASAEVGEWFIRRHSYAAEALYRSRFL